MFAGNSRGGGRNGDTQVALQGFLLVQLYLVHEAIQHRAGEESLQIATQNL
jgi:hypothetical protein